MNKYTVHLKQRDAFGIHRMVEINADTVNSTTFENGCLVFCNEYQEGGQILHKEIAKFNEGEWVYYTCEKVLNPVTP